MPIRMIDDPVELIPGKIYYELEFDVSKWTPGQMEFAYYIFYKLVPYLDNVNKLGIQFIRKTGYASSFLKYNENGIVKLKITTYKNPRDFITLLYACNDALKIIYGLKTNAADWQYFNPDPGFFLNTVSRNYPYSDWALKPRYLKVKIKEELKYYQNLDYYMFFIKNILLIKEKRFKSNTIWVKNPYN